MEEASGLWFPSPARAGEGSGVRGVGVFNAVLAALTPGLG